MNAQNDPQGWAALAMLGIANPQNKDTAALGVEEMQKARKWWQTHDPKTRGLLWQQTPLGSLMSLEELRRLGTASPEEFQGQISKYRQDTTTFGGNNDQHAQEWQNLDNALKRAKLQIEDTLIDKLAPLTPQLSALSGAFANLLGTFLTEAQKNGWFAKLSADIEQFSKYIAGDKFKNDVKTFTDNIGDMAQKVVDALKFLHLIPSGDDAKKQAAESGNPTLNTAADALPAVDEAVRSYLGGRAAAQATLMPTLRALWGNTQAGMSILNPATAQAMGFFMHQGWSGAQSAGLAANLLAESNFDPTAVGDNGKAYGIGQWHGDRQALFAKVFHHDIQHSTL